MTPQEIEDMFTNATGEFAFARWGRPIAPVVFGVDDASVAVVKSAIEATTSLVKLDTAETDPELGSNFMWFFLRDWQELLDTPDLNQLIPELANLVPRLKAGKATSYRMFRYDNDGAIQACFVFLRMDKTMAALPAEELALSQMVQSLLTWGPKAFATKSPLARLENGTSVLRPDLTSLLRVAYDRFLPAASTDPILAMRMSPRTELLNGT